MRRIVALLGLGLLGTGMAACAPEEPVPRDPVARNDPAPARATSAPPGVHGRVVDELGVPLPGVAVHAWAEPATLRLGVDLDRPRVSTLTDAGGAFHLRPPAGVELVMVAEHPHFPPFILRIGEPPPDHRTDLGDVTLVSCAGLLVEVRGDTDLPVAEARVHLEPGLSDTGLAHLSHGRSAVTDAAGVATFYGVSPGPWALTVTAEGRATTGVAHLQEASPESSPRAVVRLPPGRRLVGRVTSADGDPVADALVQAEAESAGETPFHHPPAEVRTDEQGAFQLAGLLPGPLAVRVLSDTHGFLGRELVDPDAGNLDLRLPRGLELHGRVLHARTKRPLAGAVVTARGAAGWPVLRDGRVHHPRVSTDGDGKFRFRGLSGGIVTLEAASNGLCPAVSGPHEPTAPGGAAVPSPVTLLLEEGFRVTGQVLSPAGLPLSDALIRTTADDPTNATPATRGEPMSALSSVSGRFEIVGLLPGRYRLEVRAPGLPHLFTPAFTARPNGQLEVGALRLPQGGRVLGTAFDARGRPAAFAAVHIRPDSGPETDPSAPRTARHHTVRADAHGQFRLPPVASGSYRVFYDYPDRQTPRAAAEFRAATGVTVRVGDRTDQRQDLRPRVR